MIFKSEDLSVFLFGKRSRPAHEYWSQRENYYYEYFISGFGDLYFIWRKLEALQNYKTFFSFYTGISLPKLQNHWRWKIVRRQQKKITVPGSLFTYNCCLFTFRRHFLLFCIWWLFGLDHSSDAKVFTELPKWNSPLDMIGLVFAWTEVKMTHQ